MTSREEYAKKLEARVKDLEAEVERLREKAARAIAEARIELKEQAPVWKARADIARAKVQELGKSGAKAWDEIEDDVETALRDLRKALQRFTKEFRK